MPGQPLRLAAFRRDHVHIEIAGVLAAEGDPFSVRGKMRIRGLALKARNAPRHATRSRHRPDVLRVSEGDLRRADSRRAQHARAARLSVRSAVTELKSAESDRES